MLYFFFLGGGGGGLLLLFTLGTVSCFSELDNHCFHANRFDHLLFRSFIVQVSQILWLSLSPFLFSFSSSFFPFFPVMAKRRHKLIRSSFQYCV